MKTIILRFICLSFALMPLCVSAQYREMEADYKQAVSAYELKDCDGRQQLEAHLKEYPDSPYANRIHALVASTYFFEEKYGEALEEFKLSDLSLLGNEERDDMTYRLAVSLLSTGNTEQAAIWFETLRLSSPKYREDASYYIAYIRYTQRRYEEALNAFLPLQSSAKYATLVPYYIADIYLQLKQYDNAMAVARQYPSAPQMQRIMGEVCYHRADYHNAAIYLGSYATATAQPQRGSLYMLGLSYYQTGVYSKAAGALGEVVKENDALTQNAYLHLGLSYLQTSERNKARMAFEQAAASNADMTIKERAAYNYALCIHETSFSGFGESVTVFERFLNDFPNSVYTDKISTYLVDVYFTTRSYDAALKSIQRIAAPGPKIMEAKQKILFQLGTQAFANAAFEKALDYFGQSILIGQYNLQTNADACYWRGEAYYRLNRFDEASRDFSEYLRLNRQTDTEMYALAHYNLGYAAFQRKEYAQARNWFDKYTRLEKAGNRQALADAYNRIGDSYFHIRNFGEAKRYYSQAEAMDTPAGDYSFYQLALVSGLEKDYAGKITILNRLAGKYPESPYGVNALYEKGRAYVLMENNSQAIAAFNELLAKYPGNALSRKAATEIGMLYYQDEAYDQAIAAYKKVIDDYPGSDEARLALRDIKSIYIDQNKVGEFAALASSLPGNVRFDANEQDSLTYVAAEKVYMRGRIQEAKESFASYLQSFPEGGFGLNAHYYLAMIARSQKDNKNLLIHTGKLLEYPDNPFSEEALVMQGEVQYNLQMYKEALATYKQLAGKASTPEHRLLGKTGALRSAYLLDDDAEMILTANDILAESKLAPELTNEATYYRAKALLKQGSAQAAMTDLRTLAKDTRNAYGAEAKYLVGEQLYNAGKYAEAEKELLDFIEQSTPHAYWLARGFILLSDVYVATGKTVDARQYLLSLQKNYTADDTIQPMIENRLKKLTNK